MKIFCIADIHFGKRKENESLYNELNKYFLSSIREKGADLVVLLGDLTETKLQLNSEAVMYYNKFMDDLHRLAESMDFMIIAVNGTFSHERNQIKSFSHYFDKKLLYFDKPGPFFYKGMRFYILPEEYSRSKEEETELQDALNHMDEYDFVFGHGMFDHAGAAAIQSDATKTRMSWNWKQFEKIKFRVVFGHIHIGSKYKNIIYCGSFSRDKFGEEEPKGFYYFEVNDNKIIEEKKIINKDAPKYIYVYVAMLPTELNELLKALRKHSEENAYIRIVIDKPIPEEHYNNILSFVKNHENTSVINKLPKKLAIQDESNDENTSIYYERLKKYKGMDFIEITKNIAKDLYNEDFTAEEINNAISEEK